MSAAPSPLRIAAAPALEAARSDIARARLTFLLQLAYSGELAAALAYIGHRYSVRDRTERAEIGRIAREELQHRTFLCETLAELGSAPDPARERKMARVGRSISLFCQVGGWFLPMYGAARLEAQNIREYEVAARLAHLAGLPEHAERLLELAEVEWDHELYFRSKAQTHPLWRLMPRWPLPPPRAEIRASFGEFTSELDPPLPVLRVPWLVR